MAKNTNPNTKKIYGQKSWSTITWSAPSKARHYWGAELYHDIFIKKLIHGIFQKFKYLTSDVSIRRVATGQIEISWFFFIVDDKTKKSRHAAVGFRDARGTLGGSPQAPEGGLSGVDPVKRFPNPPRNPFLLIPIIKSIITLKFGGGYMFKVIQTPNLFSNPKLVADYINGQITQDPRQHRYVLNKLTWLYKRQGK